MKTSEINKIKIALKQGDTAPAKRCLNICQDIQVLKVFIEQKMLVNTAFFEELALVFMSAAQRLTTNKSERLLYVNYIAFVRTYLSTSVDLANQLRERLDFLLDRSLFEIMTLLSLARKVSTASMVNDLLGDQIDSNPKQALYLDVEGQEWSQYNVSAIGTDELFAVLQLLSFYTQWSKTAATDSFVGIVDEQEMERLHQCLRLANLYNSLDHALSKVTYGEWRVAKIQEKKFPVFTFQFTDENFETARQISLKRLIVSRLTGRRYPYPLQQRLNAVVKHAVGFLFDEYEAMISGLPVNIREDVTKKAQKGLDGIGLEDQLLAESASDNEVLNYYIGAVVLYTFCHVANTLKQQPGYHNIFITPNLPVKTLKEILENIQIDDRPCKPDLTIFFSDKVVTSFFNWCIAPFIKDDDGEILCLDVLSAASPENWVRHLFMKGGGIADKVGKTWEIHIERLLSDHFECQVKRGIKLKKQGKILTDIDILAIRDDLLLIIQIKSFYGLGTNDFEQWKFRNKLIHGAAQAKIALEVLKNDPDMVQQVFGPLNVSKVASFCPIVLTNDPLFNGWQADNVSVMSIGALHQLINGATVHYTDIDGVVHSKRKMISGDKVNSEELLRFIRQPLDWQLSREHLTLAFHEVKFDQCILRYPYYENAIGSKRGSPSAVFPKDRPDK